MTTRTNFHDVPLDVAGDLTAPRAVIVIQEAFGVNEHIREVTDRFASQGFLAVAPELFHRVGSPEIPYDDFPEAMTAMGSVSKEGLVEDLNAAVGYLHDQGFTTENIGIVGYCMGGTVTFFAATTGQVGAAASYYGGGVDDGRFGLPSLLELAPELKSAWRGYYGDLDAGIPVASVEALRSAAATSGRDTDIVRYADGDHGFHCDGRPGVFNADAAADAYAKTLAFFSTHLAARA